MASTEKCLFHQKTRKECTVEGTVTLEINADVLPVTSFCREEVTRNPLPPTHKAISCYHENKEVSLNG